MQVDPDLLKRIMLEHTDPLYRHGNMSRQQIQAMRASCKALRRNMPVSITKTPDSLQMGPGFFASNISLLEQHRDTLSSVSFLLSQRKQPEFTGVGIFPNVRNLTIFSHTNPKIMASLMATFPNVQSLNIRGTRTKSAKQEMATLSLLPPTLTELSIHASHLDTATQLTALHSLTCMDSHTIPPLAPLTKLLTDHWPTNISTTQVASLSHLKIWNRTFCLPIPSWLINAVNLTSVELYASYMQHDADAAHILQLSRLPQLKQLTLMPLTATAIIQHDAEATLNTHFPHLERLVISQYGIDPIPISDISEWASSSIFPPTLKIDMPILTPVGLGAQPIILPAGRIFCGGQPDTLSIAHNEANPQRIPHVFSNNKRSVCVNLPTYSNINIPEWVWASECLVVGNEEVLYQLKKPPFDIESIQIREIIITPDATPRGLTFCVYDMVTMFYLLRPDLRVKFVVEHGVRGQMLEEVIKKACPTAVVELRVM